MGEPEDEPYDITEYLPEDFEDNSDDPRPRTQLKRVGRGGAMIGAAMIGLAEILQPKPKQDAPIEIATPGEPPNIDTNGLDEPLGAQGERMVGPPMDYLKARGRPTSRLKRRR